MSEQSIQFNQCLRDLQAGDKEALARMLPLIYEDLRELAGGIQRDREHSLNPTALVHEAYARLVGAQNQDYENRRHFMIVASMAMRQLLTDYARTRRRHKRGGEARQVMLQSGDAIAPGAQIDLVDLDEALAEFGELFPRQAKVVELRFLARLTVEEAAEALDVSPRTVKVDWQMAKAWLSRRLESDESS